jgi:hypothetical protein
VEHARQHVARVAVDAHDVLRLGEVAAEQVDARRLAALDVLGADQHVVGIVGRDDRRGEGDQQQRANDDQADLAGTLAQQPLPGLFPQRHRVADQAFLGDDVGSVRRRGI